MSWHRLALLSAVVLPTPVLADGPYKVEVHKEPPPAGLAAEVKGALAGQGYRFVDEKGKTYAEVWLRKAIPASSKPGGPEGAVQFPFLAAGELLGALRFPGEGHDYRDQTIVKGVYTLRYGLQPVNGDHLGASTYRDYALLVPAAKDAGVKDLAEKKLNEQSAEAAGTSHPAVLILLMAPEGSKGEPSVVHDETKNTWSAVLPLSLEVKGQSGTVALPVQLVLIGAAAV